jgi:hypothetical protein
MDSLIKTVLKQLGTSGEELRQRRHENMEFVLK